MPSSKSCDATQYLQVTSSITKQETNQFDTRICEYTLNIQNTHPTDSIRYYVYQHNKDAFQYTEGFSWLGNFPLNPGTGTDSLGSMTVHMDKDASGPSMSIPEKIAGIYASPECSQYYMDENFLVEIAKPVSSACTLE